MTAARLKEIAASKVEIPDDPREYRKWQAAIYGLIARLPTTIAEPLAQALDAPTVTPTDEMITSETVSVKWAAATNERFMLGAYHGIGALLVVFWPDKIEVIAMAHPGEGADKRKTYLVDLMLRWGFQPTVLS